MNACIIGNGMVGNATGNLFGIKKRFDIDDSKSTATLEECAKCRICFICLPTNIDDNNRYRMDDIINIVRQINDYGHGPIFVIRSTVFPGFADHLKDLLGLDAVISNPEFLSEATAEKDIKNPPFVLLGGEDGIFMEEIKAIYNSRLKSVNFILTTNRTAEMAKLALNGYFATKVIFANQLFDACQRTHTNYAKVREVLERHPFGPKNHFSIWYKGKRGVNGSCLPKDTKALAEVANIPLLKKVMKLNEEYIHQHE